MRTRNSCILTALAIGATVTAAADASFIVPGDYQLHNHPDGTEQPPLYGLRLDELFDLTPGADVFTFDFDADGAAVFLNYDGNAIHIFGTAFGGLDTGEGYDPENSSFVEIDFTYSQSGSHPTDDDLIVDGPDFANSGTLTWMETGQEIPLFDYAGDNGYVFRMGDGADDEGHRGFDGISGWGWLFHGDNEEYRNASDWLFTAELVPAPGALAFLGLGVFGRRRRRN